MIEHRSIEDKYCVTNKGSLSDRESNMRPLRSGQTKSRETLGAGRSTDSRGREKLRRDLGSILNGHVVKN